MTSTLRALECSRCGAPLGECTAEEGSSLRCGYCGAIHQFALAPGQHVPPTGLTAGGPALVLWGQRWWNAHVVRVVSSSEWEISYDGWAPTWNEVVGPDRIAPLHVDAHAAAPAAGRSSARPSATRLVPGSAKLLGGVVLLVAVVGVWAALRPSQEARPGSAMAPTPAASSLVAGSPIEVLWQETWYDARVVENVPGGRVRIHYVGWNDSWDEEVTLDRVRLPR